MPMGGDSSGRFHSGTLVGNLQDHGGASLPAGGSARVLAGPNRQKAILLEVARKLPVSTNSSSDTIIDLDIGQFGTLSPMFTGVIAYVYAENVIGNLRYRLPYWANYDEKSWTTSPTGYVFNTTSTTGYSQQTEWTPTGGLPLRLKLGLAYFSSDATAAYGILSVTLMWIMRS